MVVVVVRRSCANACGSAALSLRVFVVVALVYRYHTMSIPMTGHTQ